MKNAKLIGIVTIFLVVLFIFSVSVNADSQKSLTKIEVTTEPDKTEYIENESFDPTGMVITAFYDDDSTQVVTEYEYTPNGSLSMLDNVITITYTENNIPATTTQPITVKTSLQNLIINYTKLTLTLKTLETNITGLVIQANPNGAHIPELTWTSSDESVVKVQADSDVYTTATLTPIGVGTAVVTAKSADGKYSASCNVTVISGDLTDPNNVDPKDQKDPTPIKTEEKQDSTQATKNYPKTGVKEIIYGIISLSILSVGLLIYIKRYKGI